MQLTKSTAGVSERYASSAGGWLGVLPYAFQPWGVRTGRSYHVETGGVVFLREQIKNGVEHVACVWFA